MARFTLKTAQLDVAHTIRKMTIDGGVAYRIQGERPNGRKWIVEYSMTVNREWQIVLTASLNGDNLIEPIVTPSAAQIQKFWDVVAVVDDYVAANPPADVDEVMATIQDDLMEVEPAE